MRNSTLPQRPLPARVIAAIVLPGLLAATLAPCRVQAVDVPQYSIEDFLATTSMNGATFSFDGSKILVSSDQTGVFNAYAIPVAGGDPVQLTRATDTAITVRSWFPHDDRFLYLQDQGGNERTHLFVQDPAGKAIDLTPGEDVKAEFHGWAHDDRSFFVQTNERNKKFFDYYEYATDGYERTMIFQNDAGYQFGAMSRDERWIAFLKPNTTNDDDVYVFDRQTQETSHLTPHTGDVSHRVESFAPDGKSVYLSTDDGAEFKYLVKVDLATHARTVVEKPDWDVSAASFSKSGKYMVVSVNQDARTTIGVTDLGTGKRVALPKLPAGDLTSLRIARDDSRIAFYLNGSRQPSNLFVCDLGAGAATQLTQNASPRIDPKWLVDAEVTRFASYDGVPIPGILYKPHRVSDQAKAPALVWVHGGPGGQTRVNYSGLIQYLVNHGYVVYGINNRGSSGYGKSFHKMDDRKHGEADLDDCVASKKHLAGLGYVDPNRIGIIGGSYGGYMTLAALAFRPQEFVMGVDIFGVSNWVRTLESIPAWWEAERKSLYTELGDPAADGERLRRISPLFHAKNIQRPLIVLQGANDPRVLKVESDEIVAAARANGVEVNYMVFDDEGHGFRNKKNQLAGYKAILDFCDKHLKDASVTVGTRE